MLPNLLLIPGFAMTEWVWAPIVPHLEEYFSIHTADISQIDSDEALQATYNLWAKWVTPSLTILGWSLGGTLACDFCEKTGVDAKVICIGSSPKFTETKGWPGATKLDDFKLGMQQDKKGTLMRFAQQVAKGSPNKLTLYETLCRHLENSGFTDESEQYLLQKLEVCDAREQSLMREDIVGEHDVFFPKEAVDLWAQTHPVHVIMQAGHMPFYTSPEEFIKVLSDVLFS